MKKVAAARPNGELGASPRPARNGSIFKDLSRSLEAIDRSLARIDRLHIDMSIGTSAWQTAATAMYVNGALLNFPEIRSSAFRIAAMYERMAERSQAGSNLRIARRATGRAID